MKTATFAGIILTAALCIAPACRAQRSVILSERVHTLQVNKNGNWDELPCIPLDGDDRIVISFDEMSHNYRRLTYRIRHYRSDWSESDLFESDYLDGFNDLPVSDYRNSQNTTFLYTHYTLELPNDDVRLTASGNYEVTITDNSNDEELLKARFSVFEPGVHISAEVSGNTDMDTNGHNQQMSLTVNYGSLPVNDPEREIIVQATQNRRTDMMRDRLKPAHITPGQMSFTHNRDLIFPGGNEYRRFEIVNMYDNNQNVDKIDFFDPYFHATLIQDSPRREYLFDMDHNGRYLIRYDQAADSDIEADYLLVHFTLKTPECTGGDIYLDGDFADGKPDSRWRMEYDRAEGRYEKTAVLKMGAYNYRYLFVPYGSATGETARMEGDSFETENDYQIYVWFRQNGSRYDRLVGVAETGSRE